MVKARATAGLAWWAVTLASNCCCVYPNSCRAASPASLAWWLNSIFNCCCTASLRKSLPLISYSEMSRRMQVVSAWKYTVAACIVVSGSKGSNTGGGLNGVHPTTCSPVAVCHNFCNFSTAARTCGWGVPVMAGLRNSHVASSKQSISMCAFSTMEPCLVRSARSNSCFMMSCSCASGIDCPVIWSCCTWFMSWLKALCNSKYSWSNTFTTSLAVIYSVSFSSPSSSISVTVVSARDSCGSGAVDDDDDCCCCCCCCQAIHPNPTLATTNVAPAAIMIFPRLDDNELIVTCNVVDIWYDNDVIHSPCNVIYIPYMLDHGTVLVLVVGVAKSFGGMFWTKWRTGVQCKICE